MPHPKPPVELRVITRDTYRPVLRLKVSETQEKMVANNTASLAQAYFHEEARPFALHAGEELVGFVMFSTEEVESHGRLWVWRFMIDLEQQRKGHGRAAIAAMIEHAREQEGVRELRLSHVPELEGHPGPFYESVGFAYTGEVEHGELIMSRDLSPLA